MRSRGENNGWQVVGIRARVRRPANLAPTDESPSNPACCRTAWALVLSSSSLAASVGLEARVVLGFLSVMAVAYSRVKSNRCFVVVFFCLWGVGRYILSIVKSTQCLLTAKPADVHSAIVGKPNRER